VSRLSLAQRKKAAPPPAKKTGPPPKAKRVWDASGAAGAAEPSAPQLDFSGPVPTAEGDSGHTAASPLQLGRSAMDADEAEEDELEDLLESDEPAGAAPKRRGWFAAALRSPTITSVLGKASLEADDLAPILEELKVNLLKKNVASEIADKLCDSVAAGLLGRKLASFTSLGGTVRVAMEAALTRILTPSRSVDVLRDIEAKRAAAALPGAPPARPYVIVFVGVNGVGKRRVQPSLSCLASFALLNLTASFAAPTWPRLPTG